MEEPVNVRLCLEGSWTTSSHHTPESKSARFGFLVFLVRGVCWWLFCVAFVLHLRGVEDRWIVFVICVCVFLSVFLMAGLGDCEQMGTFSLVCKAGAEQGKERT